MRKIFADYASTTPVHPSVLKAMLPYMQDMFGNPSSFHSEGLRAARAVSKARAAIAAQMSAHEDEIVFTSGGTESDNLALQGIIRAHVKHGNHVVTSSIEHPAVRDTLSRLERDGSITLTIVPVDATGIVDPRMIAEAITSKTVLVSVMAANNEIGTIQPIAEIGREILKVRKANNQPYPYFHTDACHAVGALELNVEKLHVDLLSSNGSKIYGPKGIGALFVKRGLKLTPLLYGGGQERRLRPGTENVAGIVGLAKAFELAARCRDAENARLTQLRDTLIEGLLTIPKTRLNGHPTKRLPNNVNISFLDIEGEAILLYMDAKGIQASTGSACASQSLDPSHVILALGQSYETAHGSIRFSLGRGTSRADVDQIIRILPGIVEKLRHMSPVQVDMKYFDQQKIQKHL